MNLKLDLTEDCHKCGGMGYSYKDLFGKPQDITRIQCDRCRGTGDVPTWQGLQLLAFVETYKDWNEDD